MSSFSITRMCLVLWLLSSLIYLPFIKNQLVWDDEQFIYNNSYVRQFELKKLWTENTIAGAGEVSNYYRPLTSLSFAIDFQFWGINPVGYHLTNLLLHSIAGTLLLLFLRALKLSPLAAFAIAAIFITHPVQTEAVTYANSRGDSLYTVFGFVSLIGLTQLLRRKNVELRFYNLHVILSEWHLVIITITTYWCSILSKEIGIALLGLHALVTVFFYLSSLTSAITKVSLKKFLTPALMTTLTACLVSALFYLLLRATILNFHNSFDFYGQANTQYSGQLETRMLTFSKILWIYLKLLLIPYPLHMERSTELVNTFLSPWPILTISTLLILLAAGYSEWRSHQRTWIWFALGWVAIMLSPVSGILPINGLLYEHWLYTPVIGFSLLGYALFKLTPFTLPRQVALACLAAILSCLVLLSWRQNFIWSSPIRLYTHILQYSQTARVHNNLAMAYAETGEQNKAIEHYQKALEISNIYPQIHYNLANTLSAQGEIEKAIESYRQALALSAQFEPAYFKLIQLFVLRKEWENANKVLKEWSAQNPDPQNLVEAERFIETSRNLQSVP
ncbi:tetratricopeptide repeat protein [Candidatus Woesebacteria bacterium]|nr:tetratricopeptide repeat protein [Candidatus Woesebacteria bacterium]